MFTQESEKMCHYNIKCCVDAERQAVMHPIKVGVSHKWCKIVTQLHKKTESKCGQ